MNIKTINLTGGEVAVKVGGGNSEIKNNGAATIYASAASGIVAGADGVVSIPAGASVTVTDTRGIVYILGTGSVEVVGKDFVAPVFRVAAAAGGSGSNLLRNPNFAINQRGKSLYDAVGYTVDGWKLLRPANIESIANGIKFSVPSSAAQNALFVQTINRDLDGARVTISIKIVGEDAPRTLTTTVSQNVDRLIISEYSSAYIQNYGDGAAIFAITCSIGNYVEIEWAKIEFGDRATPFIPPEYSDELARCQRYYQTRTTGDVAAADMRPTMATIKDIKQREDGLYEYIAE